MPSTIVEVRRSYTAEEEQRIIEVPRENWGLRGGKPASEIDLGFEVEV